MDSKNGRALLKMGTKQRFKKVPGLPLLVRLIRKLARPGRFLVWHTPIEPFRSELIHKARQQAGTPFLEVACGNRRLGPDFINLDLQRTKQVDVLADGCSLPFMDNSFGLVWMEAVLEHLAQPVAAVQEVQRVLRPGGRVYVEIPFLQGYHADPGDYQRLTMEGLRYLFRDFEVEWVRPCSGPASTFCYSATAFLASLFSFGSPWMYKVGFHYVFCYLLFPFKYLDALLVRYPESARTAFGYALLARKLR
jgi:SAM-dependent methyltransferase